MPYASWRRLTTYDFQLRTRWARFGKLTSRCSARGSGREQGTVRKDWGGRLPIALCYPNSYAIGMCNLGFQSVYSLFNSAEGFVCERFFAEPVADRQPLGGTRRLDRATTPTGSKVAPDCWASRCRSSRSDR